MLRNKMTSPHSCEKCCKIFENRAKLLLHARRVHPSPEQSCICKICSKNFKTKSSLSDHNDKVHSVGKTNCDICYKKFKSSYRLRVHVKIVHLRQYDSLPKTQCEICGREFKNIKLLQQHSRRVHKSKSINCSMCKKTFKSSVYLKRHLINVHSGDLISSNQREKKFKHMNLSVDNKESQIKEIYGKVEEKCLNCNEMFSSKFDLYYHMKSTHNDQLEMLTEELIKQLYKPKKNKRRFGNVQCDNCHKTFKHKYYLIKHIKIFHRTESGVVDITSGEVKISTSKLDVSDDMSNCADHTINEDMKSPIAVRNTENVEDRVILSDECDNGEILPNTDYSNSVEINSKNTKLHKKVLCKCKSCLANLENVEENINERNTKSDLDVRAISSKHKSVEIIPAKWVCEVCCKMFKTKTNLNRHVKCAHPLDIERTSCTICWKEFKAGLHLAHHMRSVHSIGSSSYICDKCSKMFKNKIRLQRHIKRTHMSTEKFNCNICSMIFTARNSLKTHKGNIHAFEDLSKTCAVCKKVLSNEKCLRAHMKSMHSDDDKIKCNVCKKMYKNKDSLRIHMNIHKSILDFECAECRKKFKNKIYLQQHMRRKHSLYTQLLCKCCFITFRSPKLMREHLKSNHYV